MDIPSLRASAESAPGVAGSPERLEDATSLERKGLAFKLLRGIEVGEQSGTWLPANSESLGHRIALLATLLDVVPRSEAHRLDDVIDAWARQFSLEGAVSAKELKQAALAILKPNLSSIGGEGADNDAQRQCESGLRTWADRLRHDPNWTHLPSVVPGESRLPIERVFVELFAVAEDDSTENALREAETSPRQSRRMLASQYPVVSVSTMVARTLERCVVMGEPGSGKSTLVQWVAKSVANGEHPDYDVAAVVRLSAYAEALAQGSRLGLSEFFLQSLGNDRQDWQAAAAWLRSWSRRWRRCLLLLDGWDEVPVRERDTVRSRIEQEQPDFVTLITSRPSGAPRQLGGAVRTDFYRIAGLTPRSTQEYVANLLEAMGRRDLTTIVLGRIEREPDWQEIAANPFLLGLLVRVLVRTEAEGTAPKKLADIYEQIAAWMAEQYAQSARRDVPLSGEHLEGLRRLSHDLLFEEAQSRYLFRWRELTDKLGATPADAVLQSRFVNRIDPVYDEYAFLHATFQEYFAAVHASKLGAPEFDALVTRALQSASRLIVLEFMAGLPGAAASRLREQVARWLDRPDRFRQVLLRVARVVTAGRWGTDGLGRKVREELWREIATNDEMSLVEAAVTAFAELDPIELCRRAKQSKKLSEWVVNCLLESVPASIAQDERLVDLMPGKWRNYAGLNLRGDISNEAIASRRRQLADARQSDEDRSEAIAFVGAGHLVEAVPVLIELLCNPAAPLALREEAIDSLGAIGGRLAIDALVDVVTGKIALSAEGMLMASTALRNTPGARKALDPVGRDRLLRRLAIMRPDSPEGMSILRALEGHPIRDGAELICEIAMSGDLPAETRSQAIRVLGAVGNRSFLTPLVAILESEPIGEVFCPVLELAVIRRLSVPLRCVQQRIGRCRNRVELHRLLKLFVQLIPHAAAAEWEYGTEFIHHLIKEALRNDAADDPNDLATALTAALPSARRIGRSCIREDTLNLALSCLGKFTGNRAEVADGRVLLSAAIVEQRVDGEAGGIVRRALDAALDLAERPGSQDKRRDRIASALANCLVRIAPGELLEYPMDCEPVQWSLRRAALEQGWIVFDREILDAEGNVVVAAVDGESQVERWGGPGDLADLLSRLSAKRKNSLYSYWLMVGPRGPCDINSSFRIIYEAMVARLDGGVEDDIAESLGRVFTNGIPKFDAWRKSLERLEYQFKSEPQILGKLRMIGLCRRGA